MSSPATLGADDLRAVMGGYRDALRLHQTDINRLNVYPVPDGDTGTNMALTLEAVVSELEGVDAGFGAPSVFDAGGFSQTSPTPAWLRTTPLVLFTRQIASTSGVQAQAVAADRATGDATLLADAGSNATPAVARSADSLLVAWAAQAGGIAVSIDR